MSPFITRPVTFNNVLWCVARGVAAAGGQGGGAGKVPYGGGSRYQRTVYGFMAVYSTVFTPSYSTAQYRDSTETEGVSGALI